jgi:hypothetical protein
VLSGWDGFAESEGSSFLPAGKLRFEVGVGQQPKRKADEDWANRRTTPGAADLCFVFVTPRRWRDGKAWAQQRRAEGIFGSVCVLDGDDLDGWLRTAPAVHYWISERLGRKPGDAETLEQWWDLFSRQTKPTLPSELFLAGREAARNQLAAFLDEPPDVLTVQAAWREDALAFIASALSQLEEQRGALAPRLVVKSAEAWAHVCSQGIRTILIPLFDAPDLAVAFDREHHVLIPAGSDETVRGAKVALDRPHREPARRSLEAAGLSFERAYNLSALARRSMPSFVRSLSRDRRLRAPAWSVPETARMFAPLVLLGSWTTTNQADLALASELAGADWEDVEVQLRHWLRQDDTPFVRSGETQWHLASPDEAFMVLHHQLTSTALDRWRRLAPRVLLELDPVLDLPPNEQLLAGAKGIGRMYSPVARRGVADGLALVGSLEAESLGDGSTGEAEARHAVEGLLTQAAQDATGRTWQSLSDVLPRVAEAAPRAFLDAVDLDLSSDSPILATMFQDGDRSSWFSTSSAHTGLLWALETLCWSGEYLVDAALSLARLQVIDPGGKLANRPIGSLQSVLVGWVRHTSAPMSEKSEAVRQICKQFRMLAGNCCSAYGRVSTPRRCHQPLLGIATGCQTTAACRCRSGSNTFSDSSPSHSS